MPPKTVVLFVHGAWHSPNIHYAKILDLIRASGTEVIAPVLPTLNGDKPPTKSLKDDAEFIHAEAKKLVERGDQVLVFCHSYGGMVATNGLTQDLSYAHRHAKGEQGGIVRLLYLCAFIPSMDVSLVSVVMESGAKLDIDVDEERNAFPKNPREAFFADVDEGVAKEMSDKLITHPITAHMEKTWNTAWQHFPITYVFCLNDQAIVIAKQREMVEKVKAAGVTDIVTEEMDTSHSPFLSKPEATRDVVKRALAVSRPAVAGQASGSGEQTGTGEKKGSVIGRVFGRCMGRST